MDKQSLREEIKFRVTGGVLDLEISDAAIDMVINSALREMQRYICSTHIATVPYERCIDTTSLHCSTVVRVFRVSNYISSDTNPGISDPMYLAQWQLLSNRGDLYNFEDYSMNYAAWNTLLQIQNTSSTDLAFTYDKSKEKLYINIANDIPTKITIMYIPRYDSVEDINSDYWIDILTRLCVALTKETLGRMRSRYTQANAQWTQDGEAMLAEGREELAAIREHLQTNTQLLYPMD